jgi:hypothetical protein
VPGDRTKEYIGIHNLSVEVKSDKKRIFYFRFPTSECSKDLLPTEFTNVVRVKGFYQCQTMSLMKLNQKVILSRIRHALTSPDERFRTRGSPQEHVDLAALMLTNRYRRRTYSNSHKQGARTPISAAQVL